MQEPDSSKLHSLMTPSHEFLNETADSSQLTSLEVDKTRSITKDKNSKKLLNSAQPLSDAPPTQVVIVHPSYSQPSSKPFNYQPPMYPGQSFLSKYFSNSKKEEKSEKHSYLPPQQYGGMLDELVAKDRFFKIQMADNELNRNQFSCYRYWLLFMIPVSFFSCIGLIWLLFNASEKISQWIFGLLSFLMIWNTIQCFVEFLAIRTRSFSKADKALKSFCLYLLMIFMSSIAINLGLQAIHMQEIAYQKKIALTTLSSLGIAIFFYVTTISGAVKVYQVLRKKNTLQTILTGETHESSEAHLPAHLTA